MRGGIQYDDDFTLGILLYADDIALLAESEDDLQKMLNLLKILGPSFVDRAQSRRSAGAPRQRGVSRCILQVSCTAQSGGARRRHSSCPSYRRKWEGGRREGVKWD